MDFRRFIEIFLGNGEKSKHTKKKHHPVSKKRRRKLSAASRNFNRRRTSGLKDTRQYR